jgi:hypothetical protein
MVLALLPTREPVLVDGRAYFDIVVPTAPVPLGVGPAVRPPALGTPGGHGHQGCDEHLCVDGHHLR